MPRPPPALPDELVEEILLRLPPDTPESLVHPAAVCKRWRRLVTDARFGHRFREQHRTPSVLGFLADLKPRIDDLLVEPFVPVTRFRPTLPLSGLPPADHRGMTPCDARHGRVLLREEDRDDDGSQRLVVWDPITGGRIDLPSPPPECRDGVESNWIATVLCTAAGCEHLDCRGGPFVVVLVVTIRRPDKVVTCVFSSESGAWGELASTPRRGFHVTGQDTTALVGDGLHLMTFNRWGILRYDLVSRKLNFIKLPVPASKDKTIGALMATQDGRLGIGSFLHRRDQ